MAITINAQPNTIHSSGNTNFWAFESTLRFAPRFNLRLDIVDQTNNLYNTVLVPSNPNGLNILDIKNIIDDYCSTDFNPTITSAIANTSTRQYRINAAETFEGFYIFGSSSGGTVGTVSVVNNLTYTTVATPSSVLDIGFLNGSITSSLDSIYVIGFGTASNGYINRFTLSRNENTFLPLTASIGFNSPGYVVLNNYPIYSTGATTSTSITYATKAYIDYLDYNSSDNFSEYKATSIASKFLTKAPRNSTFIQPGERATLSFIQSNTQQVPYMYVVDNLGGTYSKALSFTTSTIKIDIPSGTSNLNINPNADWYDIRLQSSSNTAQFATLVVDVADYGGDWTINTNQKVSWTGFTFSINADLNVYTTPTDLYENVILDQYESLPANAAVKANYTITNESNDLGGYCRFRLTAKVKGSTFNFNSLTYTGGQVSQYSLSNATNIYSETFRYYVRCLNTYWTPMRLCWMNSFGGIDYYTFKFVSQSGKKVERSNFDRNLNYGSTNQDRGITTYKLNDYDQFTVVSELIDDETSLWLQDLYTSKEVYWLKDGTTLIPITLTSDTYERNVGIESKEVQVQFRLSRTNKK